MTLLSAAVVELLFATMIDRSNRIGLLDYSSVDSIDYSPLLSNSSATNSMSSSIGYPQSISSRVVEISNVYKRNIVNFNSTLLRFFMIKSKLTLDLIEPLLHDL